MAVALPDSYYDTGKTGSSSFAATGQFVDADLLNAESIAGEPVPWPPESKPVTNPGYLLHLGSYLIEMFTWFIADSPPGSVRYWVAVYATLDNVRSPAPARLLQTVGPVPSAPTPVIFTSASFSITESHGPYRLGATIDPARNPAESPRYADDDDLLYGWFADDLTLVNGTANGISDSSEL